MSEDGGKGIVMRKEDLREAIKRAAERDGHRLGGGQRKREATVASVYERQVRTPGSIRGVESQKEEAPQVRARHNRVWVGVGEPRMQPEQVTEKVFEEARRRDPEGKRPWLTLVDGHEGQLGDIHAEIDRSGVEVRLILDSTCF